MYYSVRQAAEATGKTKPTILRAIQKGKISAKKDEHGEWEIDPAELHRVYEPVPAGTDTHTDAHETADSREIELLREMLADKDRQIEGLNRRLEAVDEERRTTLRQLTALLTDQRAKAAPDVIVTPPPTSNAIPMPTAAPPAHSLSGSEFEASAEAAKPPIDEANGTIPAKGKGWLGWLTG
jgi:excisionase family DNA binding protein